MPKDTWEKFFGYPPTTPFSYPYHQAWIRLLEEVKKKPSWGNIELQKLMLDCLVNPDKKEE